MILKLSSSPAAGQLSAAVVSIGMLSIALTAPSPSQGQAQTLSCEEWRPIRGSEVTVDSNVKAGAGYIVRKIIGGEIDASGQLTMKEMFPEIFDGQDLFEIERFYYMLCLALADERIDPQLRVEMFMQASRERRTVFREAFNDQVESNDPSVQAQAIERGVRSKFPDVQAAAVEAAIGTSDVIAGTIVGE